MGCDAAREPGKVKALLGVVPQGTNLFHYLTVYQHLRIFAKLRGFPPHDAARRADELVVDLELSSHRDVSVDKLSGWRMIKASDFLRGRVLLDATESRYEDLS